MKFIVAFFLYLWQLPQNIIGLVMIYSMRPIMKMHLIDKLPFYASPAMRGGISLGRYIIIRTDKAFDGKTYNHEYGHTRQSAMLGWLYLIVIGIPSITHAAFHKKGNYYAFWTERWADKLGGVIR